MVPIELRSATMGCSGPMYSEDSIACVAKCSILSKLSRSCLMTKDSGRVSFVISLFRVARVCCATKDSGDVVFVICVRCTVNVGGGNDDLEFARDRSLRPELCPYLGEVSVKHGPHLPARRSSPGPGQCAP